VQGLGVSEILASCWEFRGTAETWEENVVILVSSSGYSPPAELGLLHQNVRAAMVIMDLDGNGQIDYDEFRQVKICKNRDWGFVVQLWGLEV